MQIGLKIVPPQALSSVNIGVIPSVVVHDSLVSMSFKSILCYRPWSRRSDKRLALTWPNTPQKRIQFPSVLAPIPDTVHDTRFDLYTESNSPLSGARNDHVERLPLRPHNSIQDDTHTKPQSVPIILKILRNRASLHTYGCQPRSDRYTFPTTVLIDARARQGEYRPMSTHNWRFLSARQGTYCTSALIFEVWSDLAHWCATLYNLACTWLWAHLSMRSLGTKDQNASIHRLHNLSSSLFDDVYRLFFNDAPLKAKLRTAHFRSTKNLWSGTVGAFAGLGRNTAFPKPYTRRAHDFIDLLCTFDMKFCASPVLDRDGCFISFKLVLYFSRAFFVPPSNSNLQQLFRLA